MWTNLLQRTVSNQNEKQDLQIFDLLQISQKEKDLKNIYLCSLREIEIWQKGLKCNQKDFLIYIQGFFLKHRAKKNLVNYKIFRKNRVQAFDFYMSKLPYRGDNNYLTKKI